MTTAAASCDYLPGIPGLLIVASNSCMPACSTYAIYAYIGSLHLLSTFGWRIRTHITRVLTTTIMLKRASKRMAMALVAILFAQGIVVHGTNTLSAVATADIPTNRAGTAVRAGFTKTTTNHQGATSISAGSVSTVKDKRGDNKAGATSFATASSGGPPVPLVATTDTQVTLEPLSVSATATANVGGASGLPGTGTKSRTDVWIVRDGVRTVG